MEFNGIAAPGAESERQGTEIALMGRIFFTKIIAFWEVLYNGKNQKHRSALD